MPKLRILITGKVHEVGYRPLLLGLAESFEIERFFADNVHVDGKQAVEILIDADEDRIELFLDLLKRKKPENAIVEDIKVEDYDGRVMGIESYYRYLTAMQLTKIATYGGRMLEKQDETIREIRTVKEEVKATKEEAKATREEVKAVREEIKVTREELSSKLDKTNELLERRFERLEEEIERIKKALIRAGIDI